jgi:hypothetical protein
VPPGPSSRQPALPEALGTGLCLLHPCTNPTTANGTLDSLSGHDHFYENHLQEHSLLGFCDFFFLFAILGIEPVALCLLGKHLYHLSYTLSPHLFFSWDRISITLPRLASNS